MTNPLPKSIADYLDTPAGQSSLAAGAIWFRWNNRTLRVESSGDVLKSTPEQMSRPGTSVFLRVGQGGWRRYC